MTQAVTAILTRYNKLKEQEGYQILFEPAEECNVYADEGRIGQVIYNLINNALTYTGPDKTVTVTQTVEGDQVRIAVHDSGQGIPQEELPLIWNRYYRSKENHKRAIQGSGLGLSIVRSILEAHHAPYGVESQAGTGTTFWFMLPRRTRSRKIKAAPPLLSGKGRHRQALKSARAKAEGLQPLAFIRVSRLCGSSNLQKSNFLQFRTTAGWPKPLAGKSGCATLSTRCAAGRNPAAALLFSALEKATPAQPEGSHRELTSGFQGSGPAGLRVRSGRPCG